jgi:hypothetical protein
MGQRVRLLLGHSILKVVAETTLPVVADRSRKGHEVGSGYWVRPPRKLLEGLTGADTTLWSGPHGRIRKALTN